MINSSAEIQKGDIVIFKGKGVIFQILGRLLKLFEHQWDFWGWHTAIVWERSYAGWLLFEATAGGVMLNYYDSEFLEKNTRQYKWLDKAPTKKERDKFFEEHILKHYDVTIYFWTMLQYLIRHYFNHRIPKLLDDRWTCWELVVDFCETMGKPIQSRFDCPIITDLLKALETNT